MGLVLARMRQPGEANELLTRVIAEFGAAKITFPVTIDYRAQSLSRSIVVYTQINEVCNVLQVTDGI